jgi:hypothetical protein
MASAILASTLAMPRSSFVYCEAFPGPANARIILKRPSMGFPRSVFGFPSLYGAVQIVMYDT